MSEHDAQARPTRRRDRAATEARLIEAARSQFARLGYASATTKGIAGKVGCSEALIQTYFGGKEGLLLAVLRGADLAPEASLAFFERPPCPTPDDEVREAFQWIVGGIRRRAANFQILMQRMLVDQDFAQRFAEQTPRRVLVAALGTRLTSVWPGQPDPEGAAELIVALAFHLGFVDPVLLGRNEETVEGLIERHVTLLLRGLPG